MAAFGDSIITDSDVISDAYKYNVMANNSPIKSMTVNYHSHFYGDSQTRKSHTENRFHHEQEMHLGSSSHERRRLVTFEEEGTGRIRNSSIDCSETSQVPPNISRLRSTREVSTQDLPGPAYSIGSSYSVTRGTTTTDGKSTYHFKAMKQTRDTLKDHLDLRVDDPSTREYMKSGFFFSRSAVPLWEPSPGLTAPEGIKTSNVCVGDVGFFTPGGGFSVLFNVFLSYAENKAIDFDPPQDFEPYGPVRFAGDVSEVTPTPYPDYVRFYGDFIPDAIPPHSERTYISSYHLVKQKPKTLRSGTVLDLPNGFWRDQMHFRVVTAMQGYFGLHARSWYHYYIKQPSSPTIPKGHLHIVTGSYKCSAWALAYCSTSSPEHIFARLYKVYPNSDIFYQWDRQGPVVGRKGPQSVEIGKDGLPLRNQCVAVEVYSIVKTKGLQKVKKSARASLSDFASRVSIWSRSGTAR